jgi:nitrogenase molybdenum-iron protein NifN
VLEKLAIDQVLIGDLEDLEHRSKGADLMMTHSHGRQASERLGVPLFRLGLPTFDRLGAGHELTVGYRGTRTLIFNIGNMFISQAHEPGPDTWRREDENVTHFGGEPTPELVQLTAMA